MGCFPASLLPHQHLLFVYRENHSSLFFFCEDGTRLKNKQLCSYKCESTVFGLVQFHLIIFCLDFQYISIW